MSIIHERFMEVAFEEAQKAEAEGNVPVGGVIVRGEEIVARGRNLVYTTMDPTAHSETVALREAGPALGQLDLTGCTLYTTFEPCPMCCGAILVARVSTLVMGGRHNPAESSYGAYSVEKLLELTEWGSRLQLITGVLQSRGEEIMRAWRAQNPQR